MSNTQKLITRYQLILRIKVIIWWLVDIILILAVIGWTLDLLTGLHPFPSVAFVLICAVLTTLYLCGLPSQRKILNRHKRKGGIKAELAEAAIGFSNYKMNKKREGLRNYHKTLNNKYYNTNDESDE